MHEGGSFAQAPCKCNLVPGVTWTKTTPLSVAQHNLSLGTVTLSTHVLSLRQQPLALWLQWGAAHTAGWSITADEDSLCPQLPGAGYQQGNTAAHPQAFAAAQQTLSAGQELGTAPPHFPQENA